MGRGSIPPARRCLADRDCAKRLRMSTETRHYEQDGQVMSYQCFGDAEAPFQLVWAHGWGQDRNALQPLAESWRTSGQNLLIDFPGFGASPRPARDWGTADYADYCAAFLNTLPAARRLWLCCAIRSGSRGPCPSPSRRRPHKISPHESRHTVPYFIYTL